MSQEGNGRGTEGGTGSLFTPVRRTRSSDDVVAQIRRAILDDRLKKGDRLPSERQLCREFDVSRPTLREGLRTLEALGVIVIRPGSSGGIFVSEPQGDQVGAALEALLRFRRVTIDELSEFRVSFESESAHWAALRATEEDAAHLVALAERFRALARVDDVRWSTFVEIDLAFHEAIAATSKNQVRVAIMFAIHRALSEASASIAEQTAGPVRLAIARELNGIAQAVRQHDAPLAAKRMRAHVKKFSELERAINRGSGSGGTG